MKKIALGFPDTIVLDIRKSRTKEERDVYGLTWTKGQHAKIFINIQKNQHREELLDTLMHELYHAVVGMYKFSTKDEEAIARGIGRYKRDLKK